MRALRDRWTPNSRLHDRADEGKPRQFVLDSSIGWQNYQAPDNLWYPADPGYSELDGDGFNARFTHLPRLIRLGEDGKKRAYPVPGNDAVWVQLGKPDELTLGTPTSKVGGVWTWDRANYAFQLRIRPDRVKFLLMLKKKVGAGISSLTIPYSSQGLTRQGNVLLYNNEPVALLRRPTVRHAGMAPGDEPIPVDVAFIPGAIVLSFDPTGMTYPIEIDPPLDLSVAASADDDFVSRVGVGWWNDIIYVSAGNFKASSNTYGSSMRFLGVNIPAGATMTVGQNYLTLIGYLWRSGTVVRSDLCVENTNNPDQIASYADHIGRARTAAVPWDSIPAWEQGTPYQSPDISTPIQALVDAQAGTGNAMIAFWEDKDGESDVGAFRTGASWDHATLAPPAIYLEWTAGGAIVKVASEVEGLAETLTRRMYAVRPSSEIIGMPDIGARRMRSIRTIAEAEGIAESALRWLSSVRIASLEVVGIGDTALRRSASFRVTAEAEAIDDGSARRLRSVRPFSEALHLADGLLRRMGLVKMLSESLALSDRALGVAYGFVLLRIEVARLEAKRLAIGRIDIKRLSPARLPLSRWLRRIFT